MTTYTQLRSGAWGIRHQGALTPGATVTVTKRDQTTRTETVDRVVWTDGTTTLATIRQTQRASTGTRRRQPSWARGGGAWTGCRMGCREGAPNPQCADCCFDEYDC